MWPPYVDLVMPRVGLLTLSMDQMHAVLDTRPQLFANLFKDDKKKEEQEEDVEHVDQDVVLDGQGEDAANGESKDGGPSTLT